MIKLAKFFDHDPKEEVFKLFDEKGNVVYWEYHGPDTGYAHWEKFKYNEAGQEIYKECSDGFWAKTEYNAKGEETHYENSDD